MEAASRDRILVMDGAMGTMIPSPQKDSLNRTSPEWIQSIYRQYLLAGADILKTNTFNSNSEPHDFELNVAGARLARAALDEFTAANPPRTRFIAGSMGPGRDGNAPVEAFHEQARGLIEGGVDMLLVETITSIHTAHSALSGIERVFGTIGRELPVMLSITISRDGTLISGESIESFWKAFSNTRIFSVGINCGFGSRNVRPFIKTLSEMATTRVSCHPSAGLPDSFGIYDESPEETAGILSAFAREGLVDIVGGCCGTTPAHTRAIAEAVRTIPRATIDHL